MKLNEAIIITENALSNYKKALFDNNKKTWAIISAENPKGIRQTPELNGKNDREFKELCKSKNLQYTLNKGKYGNIEKSLMIYNITLEQAKEFAAKYKQESFFFGDSENGRKVVKYFKTQSYEPCNYKLIETKYAGDITKTQDKSDDFYSFKNGYKYSFDMDAFK